MTKGHLRWNEQVGAMYANAPAIPATAVPLDDDVGWMIPGRKEIPEASGTAMTHRRSPEAKDRVA